MKKLGILGGFGPRATMMFYDRILDYTNANRDYENIPCVIDMAMDIPSRTMVAKGKIHEHALINTSIKHMQKLFDCDIFATPCNSFSYFRPKIIKLYNGPRDLETDWPDIIEITSKEVLSNKFRKPLLLGGYIINTFREETYGKYFPEAIYLDEYDQEIVIKIIEDIKTDNYSESERNKTKLLTTINKYKHLFDCIILACTELSELDEFLVICTDFEVFDSSDIYAQKIVEMCKE